MNRRPKRADQEGFMRLALEEAKRGLGRTSPNPVVGALLVQGGRVVGRGYHSQAGTPHAEVKAIRAAGRRARGADLYTTLEPCNHFGRTPPCTNAILEAGVRRVVFASADPNPLVNGKGLRRLRSGGVEVVAGALREEADALNRPFFKFIRTGLPWVTLKAAVTLDGKLSTASGDSKWVTGERARARVHRLRNEVDAILVGRATIELDNPRLTTRLARGAGHNPARVILDSRLRLPLGRRVFSTQEARTIVATAASVSSAAAKRLAKRGVEVWSLPGRGGRVELRALLSRMAAEGLLHVLVEGGAAVFASLVQARLADELWLFVAPKLVGASGVSWVGELGVAKMDRAPGAAIESVEQIGEDLLVRARLPGR